ncbi:hypothetical protein BN7_4609 [Wickerhamomyces ciferrii]|uniref:Flavin reductase like domain-containing protein n=1 Tax=Wickerhamomyces ciferrii (strain ATCC 14091 / BCRC 22168 / CBS 111 / JCM 3599 / NBRC 0793 / NRRL Y-1031 F-60-10) TaxID=1206466 RepID=K0KII1_WICCF|nr:uncharacterized protein BN7_4609 [Wickerhamomyces ciferrii]CCH45030.1 hypothetical protein BN7_4609 [Wickerhamomyces ciferrii]
MSSIANQTMILTAPFANHPEDHSQECFYKGATLSSVTSLSINPKPLLQFNLQIPSMTSDLLHDFEIFGIHILPPTQESADLAKLFSKARVYNVEKSKYEPVSPFSSLELGKDYELIEIKGAGNDKIELPILKNVEKLLICCKFKHFEIQDHEIWIGEIKEVREFIKNVEKSGGLLNFNRNFHIIGEKIE